MSIADGVARTPYVPHPAVAHDDLAVRVGGDPGLVGDEDDGGAGVPGGLGEQAHDPFAVEGVEGAGRLVGEDHPGGGDERAGDGDALALAAGYLAGALGRDGVDLQAGEPLGGPGLGGPPLLAVEAEREGHVLHAGQLGDELPELEDEAEVGAAQGAALAVGERGELAPVVDDGAGVGADDPGQAVQQRGLAGTGGAHDGDDLAGPQ